MQPLYTIGGTVEVLDRYRFQFQKRFGQNFLIDLHILDKIIEGSGIGPDDCVLEIGPGIGTMTQQLSRRAGHVIAVEIDKALIPILRDTLAECPNVTVINGDILKTDIRALSRDCHDGKDLKVVANLPYYITTPIIMELLEKDLPVESITVMVQKEVARRMMTGPGTKDYGALSLAVQYYAECGILTDVSKECFIPKPNVDSSVIRLIKRKEPPVAVHDPELLFRLIRASFNQRRKTLVNAIGNDPSVHTDKSVVTKALNALGIDERIRGEALTLEEFSSLSDQISSSNSSTGMGL